MKHLCVLMSLGLLACEESLQPTPLGTADIGFSVDAQIINVPEGQVNIPDVSIETPRSIDTISPQWTESARLDLDSLGGGQVSLRWPAAEDNTAVDAYFVFVDGQRAMIVGPDTLEATISIPAFGRAVSFSVIARDEAYNRSEPLVAELSVPDTVPPIWSADARLVVSEVDIESAVLSWTPASDDVGVDQYQVIWGEVLLAETGGDTSTVRVDVSANTQLSVQVVAIDAAGQRTPGPSVDFRTLSDGGPRWESDASLSVEQVSPHEVALTWPALINVDGVTEYLVFKDNIVWAQTPLNDIPVTDLQTPRAYRFAIRPVYSEGQVGQAELSQEINVQDLTPPQWPPEATIRVGDVSETSAAIYLPTANDNHRLFGYRMTWEGGSTEVTEPYDLIENLNPSSEYTIQAIALDEAGNVTENTLEVSFRTPDQSPPGWPNDASVIASWSNEGVLNLLWPQAVDNVGIARYWVQLNADPLIDTGLLTTYDLPNLSSDRQHRISVFAEDNSGQRTPMPLMLQVQRPDQSAPSWPRGAQVLVSDLTETTLNIAWPNALDDSNHIVYRVAWDQNSLEVRDTEMQVTGLMSGQTYHFTVTAIDETNLQVGAELSVSVTMPDNSGPTWPNDANLSATLIGETFVDLTWSQAVDNVTVSSYRVTYGDDPQSRETITNAIRLDGLRPNTNYEVMVSAFDQAGNRSQASLVLTIKTTDITPPSWPIDAQLLMTDLTPHGVDLSWPAAEDNDAVIRYVVVVNDEAPLFVIPPSQTISFDTWEPWRTYVVRVFAEDEQGQQSQSLEAEALTPDVLSPSWSFGEGLTLGSVSSTSVDVSWPSATDDIAVAGYRLFVDGVMINDLLSESLSTQINNLRPMQMILIEVIAYDAALNESEPIRLSVQTPDGGPPTWSERHLQWTADTTRLTLTWPSAQDDVGVTAYRVLVDGAVNLQTNGLSALIEGLESGHSYDVRIDAMDAAGQWSLDGPTDVVHTPERVYEGFRRLSRDEYTRACRSPYAIYVWDTR